MNREDLAGGGNESLVALAIDCKDNRRIYVGAVVVSQVFFQVLPLS